MAEAVDNQRDSFGHLSCVDDAGCVAAWVCCRKCRYNLFGLRPYGRCPECGAGISYSIAPSLIRSLPSTWLMRVRQSAGLVRLAIGCVFLVLPVGGLVGLGIQSLLWVGPMLLLIGGLSVATAGFLLSRDAEQTCPLRVSERRADFTDSLPLAAVFVPVLVIIAGLLLPSISRPGPGGASIAGVVRTVSACGLLCLSVYFALRPITTFTRFLAAAFEHARPMNPEGGGAVPPLVAAGQWLLFVAIVLGVGSDQIGFESASRVAVELAKIAGLFGGIAVAAAIALLYWALGLVQSALRDAILEARLREHWQDSTGSA